MTGTASLQKVKPRASLQNLSPHLPPGEAISRLLTRSAVTTGTILRRRKLFGLQQEMSTILKPTIMSIFVAPKGELPHGVLSREQAEEVKDRIAAANERAAENFELLDLHDAPLMTIEHGVHLGSGQRFQNFSSRVTGKFSVGIRRYVHLESGDIVEAKVTPFYG